MTHSYERISAWLDEYFQALNTNQGGLELVANSRKYFFDDLEFHMYTAASVAGMPLPLNREQLLMSFVHPGLHEKITPNYYVIDANTLKVVVQFEIVFRDEGSGQEWPARQASAHYHLKADAAGELRIAKILYWTESAPDDFGPVREVWARGRAEALLEFGINYFKQQQS